jgi:hypothetical protein
LIIPNIKSTLSSGYNTSYIAIPFIKKFVGRITSNASTHLQNVSIIK